MNQITQDHNFNCLNPTVKSWCPMKNNELKDSIKIHKHDTEDQPTSNNKLKESQMIQSKKTLDRSVDGSDFLRRSQAKIKLKEVNLKQAQEQSFASKLAYDLKETTFHPQLSKYTNDKYKCRVRTGVQVYDSCILWLKEKTLINELKRQKNLEATKIAHPIKKRFQSDQHKQEFHQRLIQNEENKRAKLDRIKIDLTPTFKPKINNYSQNIKSSLSRKNLSQHQEPTVFDDLRKISDKENIRVIPPKNRLTNDSLNPKFKTQQQSFGDEDQFSANNSYTMIQSIALQKRTTRPSPLNTSPIQTSHVNILPIKTSPISRKKSLSVVQGRRNQQSDSQCIIDPEVSEHQQSTNFVVSNDLEQKHQNTVNEERFISPSCNVQVTIKKKKKQLTSLTSLDQSYLMSEMMYDYLASDFNGK